MSKEIENWRVHVRIYRGSVSINSLWNKAFYTYTKYVYKVTMVELGIWISYVSDEYKYGILSRATRYIYIISWYEIFYVAADDIVDFPIFFIFPVELRRLFVDVGFFGSVSIVLMFRFFFIRHKRSRNEIFHRWIQVARSLNWPDVGRLRDGSRRLVFVLRNERNYKAILAICIYAYCEVLQTYTPFG